MGSPSTFAFTLQNPSHMHYCNFLFKVHLPSRPRGHKGQGLGLSGPWLFPQPLSSRGPGQEDGPLVDGQGLDRGSPAPGAAAPVPVLRVLLLLLTAVHLQQVLLHAVGDLRAQVPDEHAAAEAKEGCRRGRNSEYGSHLTPEPPGSSLPRPYFLARKTALVSLAQGFGPSQVYTLGGVQGIPANQGCSEDFETQGRGL